MKNLKENYDKSFEALQAFMHKFSKAPLTTGQIYLDQAAGKSGHNISASEIRVETIPAYRSKFDDDTDYDPKNPTYEGIIKYFEKEPLTPIPYTNNRSWYIELADEEGNTLPQRDFIAPTDVLRDGKYTSDGYTAEVYDYSGKNLIAPINYTFDYYSGILTFTEDVTDEQINILAGSQNTLHLTAFQYTGSKVNNYVEDLKKLSNIQNELTLKVEEINNSINEGLESLREYVDRAHAVIEQVSGETIAIQHINFSTESTDTSVKFSKPYELIDKDDLFIVNDSNPIYVSDFEISLSGYCWEVICKNINDVILTDISHEYIDNCWQSVIKVQIAVNPETIDGKPEPIIGWDDCEQPIFGKLEFTATMFKRNGRKKY